jgi:hypothetical protein
MLLTTVEKMLNLYGHSFTACYRSKTFSIWSGCKKEIHSTGNKETRKPQKPCQWGTDQVTETETGPQDFNLSQSFCFFKARKLPLPAETETGGECRVLWYVSEAQKLGISCRISRIQKLGRNTQISDGNPEIFVADGKFLLPAPPYVLPGYYKATTRLPQVTGRLPQATGQLPEATKS